MHQLIHQRFPGTEVIPRNYPPPPTSVALAKLVNLGQLASVGLTFFGEKICEMVGMPTRPEFVQNMQSNKMGSAMGAWFIGNTASQSLLNTGAFEIYYDGEVIFSKLDQKRLPTIPEIMNGLGDAIDRRAEALGGASAEREALPEAEGAEGAEETAAAGGDGEL